MLRPHLDSALDALGLTITDLCSGTCLTGLTGSGKTSVLKILLRDVIRQHRCGAVFTSVKQDDAPNYLSLLAPVTENIVHLKPGNGSLFNPLTTELIRDGGSPQTAANLFMRVNEVISRSSNHNEQSFWTNVFASGMLHAITACYQRFRDHVTLEHVYRFIATSPTSLQAAKDPTFTSTFCGSVLNEATYGGDAEKRALERAMDFYMTELPSSGHRVRGALLTQTSGILAPFLSEPLFGMCCQPLSTVVPGDVLAGTNVVIDLPIAKYGDGGRLLNLIFTMMTVDAALQRPITADSPYVLIVRDEGQYTVEPERDVLTQTISRSQRIVSMLAFQTLPTMYAALGGGPKAEQQTKALLGSHAIKIALANSCNDSNTFYSDLYGHTRKMFMSFAEASHEEEMSWMDQLFGVRGTKASMNQQWHHKVSPGEFTRLRKGGLENSGMIDAFVHVSGKRFANGESFKKVTFQQDIAHAPARRKRRWF